ncbi:unnamed protein product [Adineta steineri]|uniref:G-protein coupled receptors family 1 profile domain-containing protein n=1 Tax=Adineta steineri TaxID=433720 RepID=A0A815LQT9_9BILA|nr:unnamed protein product [Adineta steineri]CAF1618243.1 unnamed protein product [Adineta steineri]
MSSSSSDIILITNLKNILSQLNFYFGLFIFIFGIVGNTLNILILSQRTLRSNSCVIIFLASSTAGIIAILSGLTSRVISGVTVDLSATISWICKLRGFILYTSRAVTFWLIMLAAIDRWLLSCRDAHRRNMSSKSNSFRGIIIITILSILIHSQLFYCYEANLINTPLKCYTKNIECRLINDLAFAIIAILLPLILILIFGWMTILNTRSTKNRLEPMTMTTINQPIQISTTKKQSKKTDQRLLIMLFVQVIFLALFTLPLALQKLYATFTLNIPKSTLQMTIEDFIYQIALICTYFATAMPFYINTLSGGYVFRKAMYTLKNSIIQKVICK